jgi:uncharacterized SAM-binding protein YcdF (DUF218 family)
MNDRIIKDFTDFIFISDSPSIADIIFIPGGSRYQLSEKAAELFCHGYAKWILPSGKYSPKTNRFMSENIDQDRYKGSYHTEWEFHTHVLMLNGVPESNILREDEATHTGENAEFSSFVIAENKLNIKKAIIVCQTFHARRVLLTYQKSFPKVELIVVAVDTQRITRDNWYKTEKGYKRVMGEVERCGRYFADDFDSLIGSK